VSESYTKLFNTIIHSTIWREDDKTRILWITMLAMSDESGAVISSLPGLADAARISVGECAESLKKLMQPDPFSRTQEHEGRRIVQIDGGWYVLNRSKYRDKGKNRTEYWKEYKRRKRAKNREFSTVDNVDNVESPRNSTQEKEKEEEKEYIKKKNTKKKYLDFVLLTDEEYRKLKELMGNRINDYLEQLNDYIGSKGKRYKSHYHTLRAWHRRGKTTAVKPKLRPLIGKTCSRQGCSLPAVYKSSSGEYDTFYCGEHMPDKVKEKYDW